MINISDDQRFALSNRFYSYVFSVTPEGLLEHYYFGRTLSEPLKVVPEFRRVQNGLTSNFEGIENLNLNRMPQEYPTFGRSDYRYPAFHGMNADGNSVFSFLYKSHQVTKHKPVLDGLPSARGGKSETLIVTLEDPLHKILIYLFYTVYKDYGVLTRSAKIENNSNSNIQLSHAFSSSLDIPPDDYEVLHLHGSWAREFSEERIKVPNGRFVIESSRGTSSSAHSPFAAIMEKGATETHGQVYAATLIYSGNFAISVETGEFEDVRCQIGINPSNFGWKLKAGSAFFTPEALHVYTPNGLGDMSHIWHSFIRDKISPPAFHRHPRPTYLNTWEATYFDVNEKSVLKLADQANDMGVEMLVLDDGWFQGREDDRTSLGDWTADTDRFPSGIPALAGKVQDKGLKFGLWFEPEMVSPKSQLFEKHPDWTLHVPGRKSSLGRNQLTLDLTRHEVRDYIFTKLDKLLSCGNIGYVKWDMNRNMTEVGSATLPKDQQGEVSHRYILGLYELLARLTEKYPHILFENCASGGNRFDLGMLHFMAQTWTSDMCDPIARLDIINGASYLFPLDVMATYIGPSPNHQNGRVSSLKTRFLAGMFCASRGLSLNENDLNIHETELQSYMSLARSISADILGGRFYRLIKTNNDVCWQYTSQNSNKIYLVHFQILSGVNQPFKFVKLNNLDLKASYLCNESKTTFRGDSLMYRGFSLDFEQEKKTDFLSKLYTLEKI